jgi:hypothetical protein
MRRLLAPIRLKAGRRVAALALVLTVALSVAGPASASAATSVDADVSAKAPVGALGAEASAAADPIRTCGPSPTDKDSSAWRRYFKVNGTNITPTRHKTSR